MKLLIDDIKSYKGQDLIPLECEFCLLSFNRTKTEIKRALSGQRACRFCSLSCANKHKQIGNSISTFCTNCEKPITKMKKDIRSKNLFCGKSCAAQFNNIKTPKRISDPNRPVTKKGKIIYGNKIKMVCSTCNKLKTGKSANCQMCWRRKALLEYANKPISEFTSVYARHKYDKIRKHAHRTAELYNIATECKICKYSKKTQLCHIVGIGEFPKDTKLSVVNALTNLVFLCPTHHLELDNDLLDDESRHALDSQTTPISFYD